jgi:hypothetical protein
VLKDAGIIVTRTASIAMMTNTSRSVNARIEFLDFIFLCQFSSAAMGSVISGHGGLEL